MNRLAEFIHHHRRLIAILIGVLTLVALVGGTRLEYALDPFMQTQETQPDAGSLARLNENFGSESSDCVLLLQASDVFTPMFIRDLRELGQRMQAIEGVKRVFSLDQIPVFHGLVPHKLIPEDAQDQDQLDQARLASLTHPLVAGHLLSADANSTLVIVRLDDLLVSVAQLTPVVDEIRQTIHAMKPASDMTIRVTGTPVIRVDMLRIMRGENLKLFVVPLLLGLSVGLVIFRRLAPLLLAGIPPLVGVIWTLGMLGWAQAKLTMLSLAIPAMVYVVGFTDAVHLVLHMRRSVAQGGDSARKAALSAVRDIGGACALTSLTTATGFGSLALANSYAVQNLGIFCAFGTLLNFLCTITLIPILAGTALGRRTVTGIESIGADRALSTISPVFHFVLKHPKRICTVALGVTLLLTICTLRLRIDTTGGKEWIPPDCESIETFSAYAKAFAANSQVHVLLDWSDTPDAGPKDLLDALADVHRVLEQEPATTYPVSALSLVRSGPAGLEGSDHALSVLRLLPSEWVRQFIHWAGHCALVSAHFTSATALDNEHAFEHLQRALTSLSDKYDDMTFELVGHTVVVSRMVSEILQDLGKSFSLALVIITLTMLLVFRSVRYGPICLIPNLLPLAVIGSTMLILGWPLNISNAILFTICLGIAVDDTIHFISRYRCERKAGYDASEALARSFTTVGNAMLVTTAIFVFGFGGLFSSRFLGYRIFALLACLGFSAALLADMLILPALILCLGPRSVSENPI